jgi:nitrogen fixation protein FixH
MMTSTKKGRAWGFGAFAAYGIFVCFVLGMVLFASMQKSELVEDHPYERGLAYQSRLEKIQNATQNHGALIIEHHPTEESVDVRLTNFDPEATIVGEIRLTRPSDASLDRRLSLQLNSSGVQKIPLAGLASGLWRIEVDWKVDSVGYYYQSRMMLP